VPLPASGGGYFAFCGSLLGSLSRSIVLGEALSDVRNDIETLIDGLDPESSPETLLATTRKFDSILRVFRDRLQEADEKRAADFRQVLSSLNEAFKYLNQGSAKSDVRLKTLEKSLRRSIEIDSIDRLKSYLSDVVQSVRNEAEEGRKERAEALQSMEQHLLRAQKSASEFQVALRGKEDAVAHLSDSVSESNPEAPLLVAMFVADSFDAVRTRHGNAVADELLLQLVREHVQPLLPNSKVYSWSANSLVAIGAEKDPLDKIAHRLHEAGKAPAELRTLIGTRNAVFNVMLRSVVMQASEPQQVVSALDGFGSR
jgi:GGDEF domain-containing protein